MKTALALGVLLAASLTPVAASAEVDSPPTFYQISAEQRNCSRSYDPWTAEAAKVRLRGSDDWVRIYPLTDSIRKQIIQQRAQSMLEVKWCLR